MDRIPSLHRRIRTIAGTKPQTGTIVSFTTVRHPPAGFGTEAYPVALIALEDGTKVCAQLTAGDLAPQIGATVVPHLRRIRTMANGLKVNDFKYCVVSHKSAPIFTMTSYVLALTGPVGVGKSTITKSLLSLSHAYTEQVPLVMTFRSKRSAGEPHALVTEQEFSRMVENGEIVAATTHSEPKHTYRCGYARRDIERIWKTGKLPVVTTDIHLLEGLAKSLGRRAVLSCGLLPPGTSRRRRLSTLLYRLRELGHYTESQIQHYLASADKDLSAFDTHPHLFDHVLVNDKLETCVSRIEDIVKPS